MADQTNIATVEKPAIVIPKAAPESATAGTSYAEVAVSGFVPPHEGGVRAVVSLLDQSGNQQELGSFGLFPSTEFHAQHPAEERVFAFRMPDARTAQLDNGPLRLIIALVPFRGTGLGSRLEIDKAELKSH